MKSRIISKDEILVQFRDPAVMQHFTGEFTGTILRSDESAMEIRVDNSETSCSFLQDFHPDIDTFAAKRASPVPDRDHPRTENTHPTSVSRTQPVDLTPLVQHDPDPASTVSDMIQEVINDSELMKTGDDDNNVDDDVQHTDSVSQCNARQSRDRNREVQTEVTQSTRNAPRSSVSFHPVADSPTEEYELDAELYRLRRALAKIEKAQREFIVYSRRSLNDRQVHRLERIINYVRHVRHSIQPDL